MKNNNLDFDKLEYHDEYNQEDFSYRLNSDTFIYYDKFYGEVKIKEKMKYPTLVFLSSMDIQFNLEELKELIEVLIFIRDKGEQDNGNV